MWHTAKYGDPYSEFLLCIYPIQSAHTHSREHTHTPWTHTRSSAFMLRCPGSSWGFGVLLKDTSVVVLKVKRAVGGSVSCSRAPQSWYWRWREQLGVRCLAQGHLSRGIEGGESSWGFGVLLKDTSVVVLKVERAVGGSVSRSRAPQSWYWRWREQLGVRCLAQGHLSRGIEGGESSWGFGVSLKGTSVVVLKVERAVGGSVPCSRAPQSWYWGWREQLGVRCLAQGHLSRGIEGGGSSWGFGVLLKDTSVVVVGGSVSCSRAPQSWYWRWREQLGVRCLAQGHLSRGIEGGESSWGFGVLLKGTSVVVLKVERAVGGSVSCSRTPQSWYWGWREQLGVRCLAQEHLSRGIEGGESSWGFGVLLKSTSVVVLKVERAVGGSVSCSRAPQSWYWRWREQLGVRCLAQGHLSRGIEGGEVRCLAQGHLSRGIEGGESSWWFGVLLKDTSVVVLKVERAVGGSVSCSRAPRRGIEGGESSWGFGALLKGTSVVVLKVERAVGGSVSCSRAPQSWYWRWREQLGVRCLAQGHLSRGIEGEESSWGFGALLKGTSVVVLKVERAVGGSVSCSRAPQSWYWRWREQLGVRCLAQGHLSRGIEGGESSWGFGVLLKGTSVVVLKVERAVGGSVSCSRAPQSWYWRWREQLGVRCLAQGHLSRGIEGGESAVHSLPHLQFLPARDSNSQPFNYESNSLTIRPRLKKKYIFSNCSVDTKTVYKTNLITMLHYKCATNTVALFKESVKCIHGRNSHIIHSTFLKSMLLTLTHHMTVSHKYCSRSSDVLPWRRSWFLQFDLGHICNRVCAERWGNPAPPEPLLQPQENHREASWRWASAPLTPLPGAREQWAKHRDACWTTTWSPEANERTEGDWVCFEVCVCVYIYIYTVL